MELTPSCHGVINGIFSLEVIFSHTPGDVDTQWTNGNFY